MTTGAGGSTAYTYVIAGYPSHLGGSPYLSAVANSTTIYCTPTVGINRGATIEGFNLAPGTFVDLIYADRFTINEPTLGPIGGYAHGGDGPVILWPPNDPNQPGQTCAGVPDLYERQFNFTNFSTNTPNAQQPGNKLDLELNTLGDIVNHIRCRLSQIQRDDGFLRSEMIGLTTILDQITQARENALIVINHVAANYDAFYAASEQNISNKLVQAEAASVSANAAASSAQLMSSQASISAMNAITAKNQAIVALEQCQDILADILSKEPTIQANAQQAQQSAQAASQSESATQGYRSEVQAWYQAIQGFLVQAQSAKNGAVSASVEATGAASQASQSAGQAEASAASASLSAAQALAHSQNYIPGPVGPEGPQGPEGPAGPAGAAGATWRACGEYNDGVTYEVNDYVTFNGSSYVMTGYIGAAGYDPISFNGNWQLIASKGETGSQGPEGPQGPAGSDANMVGPQGPQGEQGPPGIAVYNWMGYYDSNYTYSVNDVVSFDGSSYVATQSNSYSTPYEGSSYWQLIARKGDQGPQGADGPQGPAGSDGSGGIGDAPYDGMPYVRINNGWDLLSIYDQNSGGGGGGIGDAPQDGYAYVRINGSWDLFSNYDQNSGGGGGGISDAPNDSTPYVRYNNSWYPFSDFDQTGGGGGGIGYGDVAAFLTNWYSSNQPNNFPGWGATGYYLGWDGYNLVWQYGNGVPGPQGPQGEQGPAGSDGGISTYDVGMFMTSGYSGDPPGGMPGWGVNGYVLSWNGYAMEWRRDVRESQINSSGYSNGSFDTDHYPYEIKITVNGSDYWVPARPA